MSRAAFEPAVPANERPHNHSLDHAATGNGKSQLYREKKEVGSTLFSSIKEVWHL